MRRFLSLVAALVLVAMTPVTSAGVVLAANLFLPLPANLPERTPPAPSQISRVYDAAGNEIGTFKQFETSIPVQAADIPAVLKQAVVAAEDRSFYSHGGVDVRGTLRALIADVRNRGATQGGSTITQQLVKNTVTGNEKTISRKIREAVLASQLDRQMDKDEILFEYLSVIYLGEGAYGVGAAAQTYFRKPVNDLTLSESALLAGLIPAPSRFNPRVDPATADIRRRQVLDSMLDEGMIDPVQHDTAVAETVWPAVNGAPPGPATVVWPPENQQSLDPYFTDYVRRWLVAHLPGGEDQIFQGGLRIETTLDPAAQAAAREQVAAFLDGTEPDLRTSLVAVEPPTGYVRAFVSGRDFATDAVNYALGQSSGGGVGGGGSGRQPGSAFKPFVLAQAFASGITPDTTYSGRPHDVSEACHSPGTVLENYEGAGYGTVDLRTATAKSVNTVFTRLILDVGVDKTMALARSLGVTGVREYDPAVHCASVALGAESVSPLDMASAYGVFAARGLRAEPTPVVRVTDRDGNIVIDLSQPPQARVLDEKVADNVTDVLEGVLVSGTAAGRGIDRPAAGKTGTTQNNRDAWFVGYTPTLSTAVWIGYENKTPEATKELRNIKGVKQVTGGTHPARLWQAFMKAALADVPVTEFTEPAPIEAVPDAKLREARRGFEPGKRKYPAGDPGKVSYSEEPARPEADAPTTTSPPTTGPPSTTTTTDPDETTTTEDGGLIN
ncbi:MAG TPA: transglycosylase domain-containing protein [Acidimicrobiales bacterium]|nr:transglycosylase domain-containing protein [Acidimicrobiales bacterium]